MDIYIRFIRSVTEYCSVVFHSSLTIEQSKKLETIQKICLKVILGEMYVDYDAALEMSGLQTIYDIREERLKCIKQPRNSRLFPYNQVNSSRLEGKGKNSK